MTMHREREREWRGGNTNWRISRAELVDFYILLGRGAGWDVFSWGGNFIVCRDRQRISVDITLPKFGPSILFFSRGGKTTPL